MGGGPSAQYRLGTCTFANERGAMKLERCGLAEACSDLAAPQTPYIPMHEALLYSVRRKSVVIAFAPVS